MFLNQHKALIPVILTSWLLTATGTQPQVARAGGNVPGPEEEKRVVVTGPTMGAADLLAWDRLGVCLRMADPAAFARAKPANGAFQGGMTVLAIRPLSAAADTEIRVGDILIGLHEWETVNREAVAYALDRCRREGFTTVRFYVVRNGRLHRGEFKPR